MEWPFSFATGPGRTAVIQLCANVEICYVFHVYNLKRLPTALSVLLTHSKVCLHGVNIKKLVYLMHIILLKNYFKIFCFLVIFANLSEIFQK